MPTKVLVFESDAAFAGELRSELGKLGCISQIVDDGNIGLQQAAADKPDLILLSIELPRMNGFSVCNKLKKDPSLKDVPLIIMSSESSEETFEQHRKLRTRAEDYVHKPIAFGELLQHIQAFVPMEADATHAGGPIDGEAIVIEDDIAESVELEDEGTQVAQRPPQFVGTKPPRREPEADAEVDAFTDAAFGRLTGSLPSLQPVSDEAPPARRAGSIPPPIPQPAVPQIDASAMASPSTFPRAPESGGRRASPSIPPVIPSTGLMSLAPRPSGAEQIEIDRLKAEVERARSRTQEVERDLSALRDEHSRLQHDMARGSKSDAESQRMQREIDELRAKLATASKVGGGVSSREFLDLREAHNKKDKEIIALKEAMARKDREVVEEKDKVLGLERMRSELDDKVLDIERELADAKDKIDVVTADKEQAKKAGEDTKNRLTRAQNEIESRQRELSELRARHDSELAAREARETVLREEHAMALTAAAAAQAVALDEAAADLTLTLERADGEKNRALEEAEARRTGDLRAAAQQRDEALASAREEAARAQADALSARESALRVEAAQRLAKELATAEAKLKNELGAAEALRASQLAAAASELDLARREGVEAVAAARRDRDEKVAALTAETNARIAALEEERDERLAAAARGRAEAIDELERDRDARIATLEKDRDDKIAALEQDRDAHVSRLEQDRDLRIASLEEKAARELADAKSVAEAQKGDADQRISELETDLLTVRGELADLRDEKRDGDAKSAQEIAELTEKLRQMTDTRDGLERELSRARDRIAALEVEGLGLRGDLDDTRRRLSDETRRADHAFAKWESDKGSLERAKDALAVALAQIEDAEARPVSMS